MPRTKKSETKTEAVKEKKPRSRAKRKQADSDIFSLDIGTRTVVGIVAEFKDDVYTVKKAVSIPHSKRAMRDGQIEDIDAVAKVAAEVRDELEKQCGIRLTSVSIAAAGRALKTCRASAEIDVEGRDLITDDMVKSFELEAVAKAQSELDRSERDGNTAFYCVGHTVISYELDGYPIKSIAGHKGKKVVVELIAAFLPSLVVESLYSVMDKVGLNVASLTLEPIAAMNVIIPPEVRLINIALADIGAGTSDIAVSQNGSIVAYAMATVAGDEITEEIIRKYLVDFDTAEEMKISSDADYVKYTDILGFEHEIKTKDFFMSLFPAVEQLADTISQNIISANGSAPAAVFLVGGGSRIPELTKMVAKKLGVAENRVAVGGNRFLKNVSVPDPLLNGPEYVTPIGIGVTATLQKGYDFSVVTVNNQKLRVFDTKKLTVLDLLMMAGYKSHDIIGRSGRSITFTLNGEKQIVRGTPAIPSELTVNGSPSSIEARVSQGDVIMLKPAENGVNAELTITDIAGDLTPKHITIDEIDYTVGTEVTVGGKPVSGDYKIQNFDNVEVTSVATLGDLLMLLGIEADNMEFFRNGMSVSLGTPCADGDNFTVRDKEISAPKAAVKLTAKPESVQPAAIPENTVDEAEVTEDISEETPVFEEKLPEPAAEEKPAEEPERSVGYTVVRLNGKNVTLEPKSDGSSNIFLDLMAIADIDINAAPPSGNMILTLNGKEAAYMDEVHTGDTIVIRWDDK